MSCPLYVLHIARLKLPLIVFLGMPTFSSPYVAVWRCEAAGIVYRWIGVASCVESRARVDWRREGRGGGGNRTIVSSFWGEGEKQLLPWRYSIGSDVPQPGRAVRIHVRQFVQGTDHPCSELCSSRTKCTKGVYVRYLHYCRTTVSIGRGYRYRNLRLRA